MDGRAVIYARFSSDDQRAESITAQVRACRAYAEHSGLTVGEIYSDEAVSGKGSATAKRKNYQRMLRDAEAGRFDVVLIHKYDRVARSLPEHVSLVARLDKAHVELVAVAQDFGVSNEGKLMRSLMWAMSEYYIDNLADEARKGHRETALKALHNGGVPPFGYNVVDQHYEVDPLEAVYVRRAFEACIARRGYRDLLEDMRAAGIKGKRGRPVTYAAIYEWLHNEKYTGTYLYTITESKNRTDRRSKPEAIRVENAIPAIIDRHIFEEAQRVMSENQARGRAAKREYLLSGLVYCSCGAPMHAYTSRRRKGENVYEYRRFVCSQKCGAPTARMEPVEDAALDFIEHLLSPEARKAVADALVEYEVVQIHTAAKNKARITREIGEREKKIDALMENLSAGALPAPVIERIGVQIAELQAQIDELKGETSTPEPAPVYDRSEIDRFFDAVADVRSQPADVQRRLALRLIDRIDVDTKKTSVSISSMLTEVVEKLGCGGLIALLPATLLRITRQL